MLRHVAVLLLHAQRDRTLAIALVEEGGDLAHDLLATGEVVRVEVSEDVRELGLRRAALDGDGVIEALATLGVLGSLGLGNELLELGGHRDGVDHHSLGAPGVDGDAMEDDVHLAGVEALVVEVADGLAVDGVAVGRVELPEVEKGGAVADLLVGNEGQLEGGVRKRGILAETSKERADLRDARLVVSREERGAVGADDVLPDELLEVGNLLGRGLDRLAVHDARDERTSLVVHDMRPDASRGSVERRVDVRAEHERGVLLGTGRRGKGARDVGVVVDLDVRAAEGAKLVSQHARHVVLGRRRGSLGLVVGV